MAREANVDLDVYQDPDPVVVHRIIAQYGDEAAAERWHWMSSRRLASIAARGRARDGAVARMRRTSGYDPLTIAVAIETAFAVGSGTSGERAVGMQKGNLLNYLAQRGLSNPAITPEERGRVSRDGARALRGDSDAAARVEARHAHERAVASVLRIALPMVDPQPRVGRYRLPEPSPELAAALAGHDPVAVVTVFPALSLPAAPSPTDAEWEAAAPPAVATPVTHASKEPTMPFASKVPTDDVIRAHHAETPRAPALAKRWGVTDVTVYKHLARLGLTNRRAKAEPLALPAPTPAAAPEPSNVVPFEAPHAEPAPAPAEVSWGAVGPARLGLEDLALAVALARRTGLTGEEAIRFVRADIAVAGAA
ncbi:hypothetical protein [uncultured Methylobacterium sp.]|uniref:hypothetical protein n=1 Tax=uncultured Methylobacterium sp. TaxID=157278 RepID=UPI00259A0201|nr:hypothetical protein [uncultured Methylobacterium sp.]